MAISCCVRFLNLCYNIYFTYLGLLIANSCWLLVGWLHAWARPPYCIWSTQTLPYFIFRYSLVWKCNCSWRIEDFMRYILAKSSVDCKTPIYRNRSFFFSTFWLWVFKHHIHSNFLNVWWNIMADSGKWTCSLRLQISTLFHRILRWTSAQEAFEETLLDFITCCDIIVTVGPHRLIEVMTEILTYRCRWQRKSLGWRRRFFVEKLSCHMNNFVINIFEFQI